MKEKAFCKCKRNEFYRSILPSELSQQNDILQKLFALGIVEQLK